MEWHSRFNIESVKFSNDGNYLLSLGDDNAVVVTDLKKRTSVIKIVQTGELMLEVHPQKPLFFTASMQNDTLKIAHRSLPDGNILHTTLLPGTVHGNWMNTRFPLVEVLYESGNPQFWVPYDSAGVNRIFCFNAKGEIHATYDLPGLTYINSVKKYGEAVIVSGYKMVMILKDGKTEKYLEVNGEEEKIGNTKLLAGHLVVLTNQRIVWFNLETGKNSTVRLPVFFALTLGDRRAGMQNYRHPFGVDAQLNVWVASQQLFSLNADLSRKPYAMACISPDGKIRYPFKTKFETSTEKETLGDIMDIHLAAGLVAMEKDNQVLLADVKNGVQFAIGSKNIPIKSMYFTSTPGKILLQVDGMQSPGFLVNLANGRMETIGVMDDIYYTRNQPGKELGPMETYESIWWPSHMQYYTARYYLFRNDSYLRYPFRDAYFPRLPGNRVLSTDEKGVLHLKGTDGKLLKKLALFGLTKGNGDVSYVEKNTYIPAQAKKASYSEDHLIKSCFYDSSSNLIVLQIVRNFDHDELTTLVVDLATFSVLHTYYGDDILIHAKKGLLVTPRGVFSLKDHQMLYQFPDSAMYGHSFTLNPDMEYMYFYVNGYEMGDLLYSFHFATKVLQYMGRQQGIDLITVDPHLPRVFTKGLDNTIMIWDGEEGRLLSTLAISGISKIKELRQADGSYLLLQPDGYYMGYNQYFKMLKLNDEGKSYSINDVDAIFHRPDMVLDNLGYATPGYSGNLKKQAMQRRQKVRIQPGMGDVSIINELHVPYVADHGKVVISASFPDSLQKYKGYLVYVNGTTVWQAPKPISASEIEIPVDLVDEINHIRVCLVRQDGVETPGDFLYVNSNPGDAPGLYLIGIGVSEYADSIHNLKYAVKDMNDLMNFFSLTDSYADIKVKRFSNKYVTPAIVDSIRLFLNTAQSRDVVICYYAGHGMLDSLNRYFLSTHSFNFWDPAQKGISIEALNDAVSSSKARKKVVFLDACHSGLVDDLSAAADTISNMGAAGVVTRGIGRTRKQNASSVAFSFNHFNQGSGVDIVAAAAGNEFAYELGSIRNGVFTYSILKALKSGEVDYNNDSIITLSELQIFVSDNTRKLTKGAQQPTFRQNNLYQDIGLIRSSDTYLNRFIAGAGENNVKLLSMLLDNGEVEIEQKNKDGFTALTMAAREGSFDAVKWLIARGANVHQPTNFGMSPLYLAAWNSHVRVTYFLLKNGANPQTDIIEWQKQKILDNKVNEISRMLVDFVSVDMQQTALTNVAEVLVNGNLLRVDSVWSLLKLDINEQLFSDGMPLLSMAILGEQEAAVKWVIEKGGSVNLTALEKNFSPLMFAVAKGNAAIVKFLLDKGANRNLKDIYGKTAIDYARRFGHSEIVALLE
jgi:ankyrin repeat protein/WD40 repeat protein